MLQQHRSHMAMMSFFVSYGAKISFMIYPLDSRNTKKLKNKKPQLLGFFCKHSYFSQIVSKKAKIIISFFMKNSKNNNIILGFSF